MTNFTVINLLHNFSHFTKIVGFLLSFFICNHLYSQRIPLEGTIIAKEEIDLEGINIFNISSNQGTVTDATGKFSISVTLNDTLSVSSIQIQNSTLIIGEEQMSSKKISINLSEKMNELATVTLRRALTGYIGTDASIIKTKEPITATSIGLPNADLKKIPKTQRLLSAASSSPVDALYNMISGRTKMLKKQLELIKSTELTLGLLDKFPESYFTDALKIEKFKVYSFLFYCEDDPDYKKVMKGNSMEIIEFLQRKSVAYKASLKKKDSNNQTITN